MNSKTRIRQSAMKIKQCKFPGCKEMFEGIGAAKYCEEHRKPEYKPEINRTNQEKKDLLDNEIIPIGNKVINHDVVKSTEIERTCICGQKFKIVLYPNVYIYPGVCEYHRNPYKLEQLLKTKGVINELTKQENHVFTEEIDW